MSYEKQNWATGDIITADKLNHMEGGIYSNSKSEGLKTVTRGFIAEQSVTDLVEEAGIYLGQCYSLMPPDGSPEYIDVTVNGVLYENVERYVIESGNESVACYGAQIDVAQMTVDWSIYPFLLEIMSVDGAAVLLPTDQETTISATYKTTQTGDNVVLYNATTLDASTGAVRLALDMTFQEIVDAVMNGHTVMTIVDATLYYLLSFDSELFTVLLTPPNNSGSNTYIASSAQGYPIKTDK